MADDTTWHIYSVVEEGCHLYDKHGACKCSPAVGRPCTQGCKAGAECALCSDGMVPVEMGREEDGLMVVHNYLDVSKVLDVDDGDISVNTEIGRKGV